MSMNPEVSVDENGLVTMPVDLYKMIQRARNAVRQADRGFLTMDEFRQILAEIATS